jgi:predicted MarR family transcription regulator
MLLENPLFDTQAAWKDGESFSANEKIFLLKMIKGNVPDEFAFMQQLVEWIGEGSNRPKPIEENISDEFDVNDTESSLMRSGTMARMIELGLVVREQSGRNVTYSLTENGEKLRTMS